MKKFIPQFIKYPLWWLFKSPQRAVPGPNLRNDLLGLWRYLMVKCFGFRKPQNISVCVGLKNRSDQFLNYFLPSLNQCEYLDCIELSVFDCGSTDTPELEKSIRNIFLGKLTFCSESLPFSRAMAVNRAVKQSNAGLIFICDADFSLPKKLVQLCSSYTRKNGFWFPIVFYLYKNKPAIFARGNGEWMLWGGKGLLACYKDEFIALGGLDESYTTWGSEDEAFWLNCHKAGKSIIRTKEPDLLHHWHPSLNPKYKKLEDLADLGLL